ncbi:hypothetical protein Bbelb_243680 [Branchiostoma belcheri]|nr:hypothetical protein Bbelb_243680 [Branchiostoma belcheri]
MSQSNNPFYHTNHPEQPTSPGQNEDNLHSDQNVLHTESNTAEPTGMSTCGQNSPSSQGQDRLEATYVAGNEVEHASTNEDCYMAPSSQGQDNLEATYVAGNEVEHASINEDCYMAPSSQGQDRLNTTYVAGNEVKHTTTDEHYYITPSSQGQDNLEATYVAGNEVEHTSTNEDCYMAPNSEEQDRLNTTYVAGNEVEHTSTNEHYYMTPSSQGQDGLEATYVAGNEVEHTSTNEDCYMAPNSEEQDRLNATYVAGNEVKQTTTDEHYYMADNNDIPNPEVADVYSVSDPIHAENSAMYTASGENEEDGNSTENSEEEQQNTENVMQVDCTVTDDGDIEPYAVANIRDNKAYHSATTNVYQQTSRNADSTVTDDGDIEPYAVTNMYENKNHLSATTNVHQQATANSSRDTTKNTMEEVKNSSTLNATELIYEATIRTTEGTTPPSLGGINGTTPSSLGTTDGTTLPSLGTTDGTTPSSLGTTDGTTPSSLGTTEGTTPPSLGGINGTTPSSLGTTDGTTLPSLGTTDGTTPPSLGTTDGTTPSNLGTTDGTTAPSLGTTEGTTAPSLGTTDGTTTPSLGVINGTNLTTYKKTSCEWETMRLSCAANELIVIDEAFSGWRPENGPRSECTLKYCDTCQHVFRRQQSRIRAQCQGLQQCNQKVDDRFHPYFRLHRPCPGIKKYLEVTYHCAAEVKKNITFGGKGEGPGQFDHVSGLAVSSTNEIFVADEPDYTIQVFSMKGVFLRSFSTGNMKPRAVCMGHNDTLWVVLYSLISIPSTYKYENVIQQYSKEGHELAKFPCSETTAIYGIAWHKLSDRIILTGKDMNGIIYVIDVSNSCILKYDKNGVLLSSFGSKGSGAGNLSQPSGICVDSLGRVIVADTWNSRVEMFTAEGEHIRTVAYIKLPMQVATEDGARLPRMKLIQTCNSILSTGGRHLGFRTPARQSCTLEGLYGEIRCPLSDILEQEPPGELPGMSCSL